MLVFKKTECIKIQTQIRYLFVHRSVLKFHYMRNEKSFSIKTLFCTFLSNTIYLVKEEMLGVIAAGIPEGHLHFIIKFIPSSLCFVVFLYVCVWVFFQ